eukprot:scaffold177559_cov31-Tisochrysis_lutea.AAC.1
MRLQLNERGRQHPLPWRGTVGLGARGPARAYARHTPARPPLPPPLPLSARLTPSSQAEQPAGRERWLPPTDREARPPRRFQRARPASDISCVLEFMSLGDRAVNRASPATKKISRFWANTYIGHGIYYLPNYIALQAP